MERPTIEEILKIVKAAGFSDGSGDPRNKRYRRGLPHRAAERSGYVRLTNIEPMANGKNRIIVTELPFMVNKARLIEKIAGAGKR